MTKQIHTEPPYTLSSVTGSVLFTSLQLLTIVFYAIQSYTRPLKAKECTMGLMGTETHQNFDQPPYKETNRIL